MWKCNVQKKRLVSKEKVTRDQYDVEWEKDKAGERTKPDETQNSRNEQLLQQPFRRVLIILRYLDSVHGLLL